MNRRNLLIGGASAAAIAAVVGAGWQLYSGNVSAESFEIQKSEAQWRRMLSEERFLVLRREQTERPFTSPLLNEKRKGTYHCAGCELAMYPSDTKYDSGTGWPSFWDSLPGAVRTKSDFALLVPRTEVHCRRCGGHFGHIFDDGPQPTGERHCLNGLALTFQPAGNA